MLAMKTDKDWPKWHQLLVADVLNYLIIKGCVQVVKEGRGFEVTYHEPKNVPDLEAADIVSDQRTNLGPDGSLSTEQWVVELLRDPQTYLYHRQ